MCNSESAKFVCGVTLVCVCVFLSVSLSVLSLSLFGSGCAKGRVLGEKPDEF